MKSRTWVRVEAVAISLVFLAASLTVAFHTEHRGSSVYGDFPSPAGAAPSTTAPHRPAIIERSSVRYLQTRFEQHPQTGSASGRTTRARTQVPSGSGSSAPHGVWTFCRLQSGGLACTGRTGSFTCTTSATTGDTSCKGSGVSITCSTDPQSGARGCDTAADSWRCVTNADGTACGGTNGTYWCAPTTNAAEGCSGSHQYYCYDVADGRSCGTTRSPAPDCFFEPVFGAFCRT